MNKPEKCYVAAYFDESKRGLNDNPGLYNLLYLQAHSIIQEDRAEINLVIG